MKKITIFTAIGLMALSPISAQAELVKGDWQTANDNSIFVDTEVGLEWLSLAQTKSMSINDVLSKLDTDFIGWRLPTQSEVTQMINSFTTHVDNDEINRFYDGDSSTLKSIAKNITNNLGTSLMSSDRRGTYSYGLSLSDTGKLMYSGALYVTYGGWNRIKQGIETTLSLDYSYERYGVFLVSDGGYSLASINNPQLNINNANAPINDVPFSAGAFFAIGLAALGFGRKKSLK